MKQVQNKLTHAAVKAARHDGGRRKLSDGGGMYLHVTESGRYWRLKYRVGGKERVIALGVYPEVSLAEARERRDDARRLIASGVDPVAHRKAQKAAMASESDTLERLLLDWLERQGWTPAYKEKVQGRLRRHILPQLGHRPAREVTGPELLAVLQAIERTGAIETARRARQHVSGAYRVAIAAGRADRNPADALDVALKAKPRPRHHAAVTDPNELAQVLRLIWAYQGTPTVVAALRLTPMLMVRPKELRHMEWEEIDPDAATWLIPGAKMKMSQDHVVPLSGQALEVIDWLRPWSAHSRFVFPGGRSPERPLSENAVTAALASLGLRGKVTGHGFRATARTILDEVLDWRPDVIEHQLAHAVRDANGRAYNRTSFLADRRRMMQTWSDYLDRLRAGVPDVVVPIREAAR